MKKLLIVFLSLFLAVPAFGAYDWRAGSTAQTIPGSTNLSDIDAVSYQNIVVPAERLLSGYRENCVLSYASAATVSVAAGQIMCSNSAGTIRKMRSNTSATTVTWSDLDTGSEAISTTYYVYAVADADANTFTCTISASSSTPSGVTYYKKLGSFYNNASGDIENADTITNDNNYYALHLGDWESKSTDTVYQADTDGFVIAKTSGVSVDIYTDSSNPPTTARARDAGANGAITSPVRKGDYYKAVDASGYVWWIPLQN